LNIGQWNCRGWSTKQNENSQFRTTVLNLLDLDILLLCETFLRDKEDINIPSYKWFGNNRQDTSKTCKRGSGGVGALIHTRILEDLM
jgi:hypothetical protein